MNREQLLELVPHYIAGLIVLFLVLAVLRVVFDGLNFWVEVAIVFVLALLYRPVVQRLGVAPSVWEE